MKWYSTALALTLLLLSSPAHSKDTLWTAQGFQFPESVVIDKINDRLIVSNMSSISGDKNGAGYLALLSPSGEVINKEWVTGLDNPKGMAILGDTLIVSDVTQVHIVDLQTGIIKQSISAPNVVFLNDVTATTDAAYISDMMTHTIWQYKDGALEPWLQDETLQHPNGLLADSSRLLVGSWGAGLKEDFTTEQAGSLLAIDLQTKAITPVKGGENMGNLDGIVRSGEMLYVNDWITGGLFALKEGEKASLIKTYTQGVADISGTENTLYLPFMIEGKIEAVSLPK